MYKVFITSLSLLKFLSRGIVQKVKIIFVVTVSNMSPVVFICNLCKKSLNGNSRTLPCSHRFCYQCLIDYFSQRQRECLGNDSFKCPDCFKDVLPAHLKKHPVPNECKIKMVMQSLKATSFLANWQQAFEFKKQEQKCDECDVSAAIIYCKQCGQYLCKKCLENHLKFTLHTGDEIIDLTMATKKIKKKFMPSLQCRTHKNAPFTKYCSYCHLFMCSKCVINHKSFSLDCGPTTDIQLLVQNTSLEMHAILKNVAASQDTIINRNEDLKEIVNNKLPVECEAAANEVLTELNEKIDLLKSQAFQLIGDIMLFKNKQIDNFKVEIAENDHLLMNVSDLSQILINMLSTSVKEDILFSCEDIKDKWSAMEQNILLIEKKEESNSNLPLLKDYQHLLPYLDIGHGKKINKLFQSIDILQMTQAQLNDRKMAVATPYNFAADKTKVESNDATVQATHTDPSKKNYFVMNDTNENKILFSKDKSKRETNAETKSSNDIKLCENDTSTNKLISGKEKNTIAKIVEPAKQDNSTTTNNYDITSSNSATIVLKKALHWPLKNVKETYITYTNHGYLLLCDIHGKTIIKYHYNGVMLGQCQVPGNPTSICTVSNNVYFVALPNEKTLLIVTLSDHKHLITISKTIQTKRKYSYFTKVSIGVLACDFSGNVDLLTTEGCVAKKIFSSKCTIENKSYLISSTQNENTFWMLDNLNQKLSCIDLKGMLLNLIQLNGPRITSIFVDKTCLYGCDDNAIYEINSNGKLNQLWLDQSKSTVNFSLVFSHHTKKLFQCYLKENKGFIRIFKISRENKNLQEFSTKSVSINSANGKSCSDLCKKKLTKKKKKKNKLVTQSQ